MTTTSGVWEAFDRASWTSAADVDLATVPANPGVYAWRRGGEVVFVGVATSSLRQTLRTHLATASDLSRSTLRASVAIRELGVDRRTARARPPVLAEDDVEVVNAWLRGCEVAFIALGSAASATDFEGRLIRQHKPSLNRVP